MADGFLQKASRLYIFGSSEEFVGGLVDIATSWTSAQARQRGSAPRRTIVDVKWTKSAR